MVIEGAVATEGRDYKPAAARGGGSSVASAARLAAHISALYMGYMPLFILCSSNVFETRGSTVILTQTLSHT